MHSQRNTTTRPAITLTSFQRQGPRRQAPQAFPPANASKELTQATHVAQSITDDKPVERASHGSSNKPRRMISTEMLLDRAGISRSHLYALRKAGRCPMPIKLSPGRRGAVRYLEHEVDAWIDALMATRAAAPTSAGSD